MSPGERYMGNVGGEAESTRMNQDELPRYLQEFSDQSLRQRLFVKENAPVLGEILRQQNRRLLQLKQQRLPAAETGPGVETLAEAYRRICVDVDAFLGTEGRSVPILETLSLLEPRIGHILRWYGRALAWGGLGAALGVGGYVWQRHARAHGKSVSAIARRAFLGGLIPLGIGGAYGWAAVEAHIALRHDGGYSPERQAILYSPAANRTQAELTIAHEYAHHIQRVAGFWSAPEVELTGAIEGMARMVDQHIGRLYAKRFQNPAYEQEALQWRLPELQAAYRHLCEQVAVTPDATLLHRPKTGRHSKASVDVRELGYAVFVILQQQRGEQVHRDILQGRFRW